MTVEHSPAGFSKDDPVEIANRGQLRHAMLVDAHRHAIADSTVLVLGAGDGGWCYTIAAAGALQVVGFEARAELTQRYHALPDVGLRARIDLRHGDPMDGLRAEAAAGQQYDVVVLLDMLEGVADLHAVFELLAQLDPRIVIGDGLFGTAEEPVLTMEPLRKPVNGVHRPVLIPSRGAIAMATYDLCFDLDWVDWDAIDPEARTGLSDYYQRGSTCRASFIMCPEDLG